MMIIAKTGTDEHGRFIDGRICTGVIRVGDIFRLLSDCGDVGVKVSLNISRIEAYRRTFEELTEGMTARVWVNGDGTERLAPGMQLE